MAAYIVTDLIAYVNNASDEELKASNIVFETDVSQINPMRMLSRTIRMALNSINSRTGNHQTEQDEPKARLVTLQEIKNNPQICASLLNQFQFAQLVALVNPDTLTPTLPLPNLNNRDDITNAKRTFSNNAIHETIAFSNRLLVNARSLAGSIQSLNQTLFSFATNNDEASTITELAFPHPADVLLYPSLELQKTNLLQELKLKAHLLNEKKKFVNDTEEAKAIDTWIAELDNNNKQTKELLQLLIIILKEQNTKANAAKNKHDKILHEDPGLQKNKKEISLLEKKAASQEKRATRIGKVLNTLKPIVSIGVPNTLLVLAFIVPFIAILTLTGLFAPAAIHWAFLGVLAACFITSTAMRITPLVDFIGDKFVRMKNAIDNKFDSWIYGLASKATKTATKLMQLRAESTFVTEYEKVSAQMEERTTLRTKLIADIGKTLNVISFAESTSTPSAAKKPAETKGIYRSPSLTSFAPVNDMPKVNEPAQGRKRANSLR
jgi:hypothetical protein